MNAMRKEKVFCIGFHKTATSSLEDALEILGYRVHGFVSVTSKKEAKSEAKDILEKYDSIRDFPWPLIFKWLDQNYPNSKFILTVRDERDWINSVCKHFGNGHIDMHEWVYGYGDPIGNEERYLEVYKRHNKKVLDYFGERRGKDIIVIDITKGDGWKKLCNFLGKKVPIFRFPRTAVSDERIKKMSYYEWTKWFIRQKTLKVYKHYKKGKLMEESKRFLKNNLNIEVKK